VLDWSVIAPAVFYGSEWAIRIVMLAVVTRRRRPVVAMAWLLIIFFQPLVGVGLYLLIGRNRLPRRRIERHEHLLKELRALEERSTDGQAATVPELGPECTAAVGLAKRLGYMPIVGGNEVNVMTRTNDVVDRLIDDIDCAENHVHLLFYIFADDATAERVAEALGRAVKRGIECRVLVDAVGSRPWRRGVRRLLNAHHVDWWFALPVNPFRMLLRRLDLRNHRKLAVIDGRIAYTGSQNIVDEGYGHRDLAWRDLMVRLEGPIVAQLQVVFVQDWYFETGVLLQNNDALFPEPGRPGTVPIQTLPSGPSYPTENYQRMVVAAVHAAQREVIITTPYFVPDEVLLQAIEVAELRGVEVRVIVPEQSDQIIVGAASRAYYENLLRLGADIYLFQDGLLHAKTVSVDDSMTFLGTANLDVRSFALNFEINLVFYGAQETAILRAVQSDYMQKSRLLSAEEWAQRGRATRLFQDIAKLFSPVL
jgi:cardiolipin synthase